MRHQALTDGRHINVHEYKVEMKNDSFQWSGRQAWPACYFLVQFIYLNLEYVMTGKRQNRIV